VTTYKADQIHEYIVYESPDGGRTVYKRKSGSSQRVLHSIDPALEAEIARERQRNLWMDMFETAERTPALQEAIDRAIMLYELARDPDTLPPDWHPV
jgi:alpha-ketoglutarate-dependent taurine dioxygenase